MSVGSRLQLRLNNEIGYVPISSLNNGLVFITVVFFSLGFAAGISAKISVSSSNILTSSVMFFFILLLTSFLVVDWQEAERKEESYLNIHTSNLLSSLSKIHHSMFA